MARFLLLLLAFLSPVFGAIATENARQDYVGTGAVSAYAFTFPVQAATELRVFRQNATGTEDELVYNTDYTVALGSDGTGTVTLTAGNLTNAYKLSIQRGVPYTQTYSPGTAPTYNAAALGRGLDRLQTEVARLKTDVARSIKIPYLEAGGDTVTKLTTVGTARSGQGIIFDASGNAIVGGAVSSGVTASAYIQTLLDDTTAAAARATLVLDDALITSDTSTTARDLSARFANEADVRDFGAVSDGTTDNSTAIAAALATGRKVVFAGGGTFLSGQVNVTASNVSIEFRDRTTLKNKAANAGSFLRLAGSNIRVFGDGIIDGNKAAQVTAAYGIGIPGNDIEVSGLLVQNTYSYGIYGLNCNRVTISRVRVVDSDSIGIFTEATSASTVGINVFDCLVDRSSISAATVAGGGIQIHGTAATWSITDINIRGNRVLLPTNPTSAAVIGIEAWGFCQRANISSNEVNGGAMSISVDTTTNGTVSGNTVYNPKSYGIELATCTDFAVTGNSLDGNSLGTRGIILDGNSPYSQRVVVTGNTVRRFTDKSVYVINSRDVTISGNMIHAPSTVEGVYLNSAQRFAIAGNLLYGTTGGGNAHGVYLDTSWNGTVSGNHIIGFDAAWLSVVATTAVTFTELSISSNTSDATSGGVNFSLSGGAVLGNSFVMSGNIETGARFAGGPTGRIVSRTAAVTLTVYDYIIRADATTAPFTVTLPTSVPLGTTFIIKRMNAGGNAVTIGGTVDGVASPTLAAQYDRMAVCFNGTNYDRID